MTGRANMRKAIANSRTGRQWIATGIEQDIREGVRHILSYVDQGSWLKHGDL